MPDTMLRPLGHKIVVKPDVEPTQTASGLYIPETSQHAPPMSGTVLRLGNGPAHDRQIRARAITRCLSILNDASIEAATPREALRIAQDEIARYLRDTSELSHVCAVGDRVIFPMDAGHEVVLDEDVEGAVVILSEDSVLAIVDAETQEAA